MTEVDERREIGGGPRAERALRRWLEGDDSAIAEWLDDGEDVAIASDRNGVQEPAERRFIRRHELAERLSHRIVREVLRTLAEVDPTGL